MVWVYYEVNCFGGGVMCVCVCVVVYDDVFCVVDVCKCCLYVVCVLCCCVCDVCCVGVCENDVWMFCEVVLIWWMCWWMLMVWVWGMMGMGVWWIWWWWNWRILVMWILWIIFVCMGICIIRRICWRIRIEWRRIATRCDWIWICLGGRWCWMWGWDLVCLWCGWCKWGWRRCMWWRWCIWLCKRGKSSRRTGWATSWRWYKDRWRRWNCWRRWMWLLVNGWGIFYCVSWCLIWCCVWGISGWSREGRCFRRTRRCIWARLSRIRVGKNIKSFKRVWMCGRILCGICMKIMV